jgi:hypothetical protein
MAPAAAVAWIPHETAAVATAGFIYVGQPT